MELAISLSMVSGGSVFSPLNLGLHHYHDADLLTGYSDEDRVDQWDDETGNGRHLLEVLADDNPYYKDNQTPTGKAAIDFRVSEHLGTATYTAITLPNTIFAVFRAEAAAQDFVWDGVEAIDRNYLFKNNTLGVWQAFSGVPLSSNAASDENWHVILVEYDTGLNTKIYIDGSLDVTGTSGGTHNFTGLRVACSTTGGNFLDGQIAAIGVYDGLFAADDRTQLMTWLDDNFIGS